MYNIYKLKSMCRIKTCLKAALLTLFFCLFIFDESLRAAVEDE